MSAAPLASIAVYGPELLKQYGIAQARAEEGDLVEDDKYVLFWHSPSWPAQWTPVKFVVDGLTYCCAEQWMMAAKAQLFGDRDIFDQIRATEDPKKHKKLGRAVKRFDAVTWERECVGIVTKGNLAKFSQHNSYRARLLSTGNKILVEASPLDAIWGIGLAASNADSRNPKNWRGRNLLGQALMNVRAQLLEEEAAKPAKS